MRNTLYDLSLATDPTETDCGCIRGVQQCEYHRQGATRNLICVSDAYDRDGCAYASVSDFEAMCLAAFGEPVALHEQNGKWYDETGQLVLEPLADPMHPRTIYLGAAEIPEGYAGSTVWVHLAEEPSGHIHAVHPWGYHTWADPEKGVGSPTVLSFKPAPSIEDLTGQSARFDTGHAYVNGVVVKDHGDGTVDCAVNAKSHTVYRYPWSDVRISTTTTEN